MTPDITPDRETGIGGWSDEEIIRAIRAGKRKDGRPLGAVPDVPRTDPVTYGAYLAGPVAHCVDCHTPRAAGGKPDESKFAAGGFGFHGPFGTSYSANLTPDPETGIGKWTDGEIAASLYGARRGGSKVLPPMPSPHYAAGIPEADLKTIIAHLRSLPPLPNRVPAPEPPKGKPVPPKK